MINIREKLEGEALERMALMGVSTASRSRYLCDREPIKVYVDNKEKSIRISDIKDYEVHLIKNFEEENDVIVYYVIKDMAMWPDGCEFFRYTMLYVGKDEEEWNFDKEECIKRCGTVPAYIFNVEDPSCSEFAEFKFENVNGLLVNAS